MHWKLVYKDAGEYDKETWEKERGVKDTVCGYSRTSEHQQKNIRGVRKGTPTTRGNKKK